MTSNENFGRDSGRHSIIAALTHEYVIGKDGELPWKIPDDLRLFKLLTTGHAVIMGRTTYDSILGRLKRPLPDRLNIVLSRSLQENNVAGFSGVVLARSLEEALAKGDADSDETFIIGGAQVYRDAMPYVTRMHLSWVNGAYDGDAFFPKFNENDWSVVERKRYAAFEHVTYDRRQDVVQKLERELSQGGAR